jgi:hypothetical protein
VKAKGRERRDERGTGVLERRKERERGREGKDQISACLNSHSEILAAPLNDKVENFRIYVSLNSKRIIRLLPGSCMMRYQPYVTLQVQRIQLESYQASLGLFPVRTMIN